MTNKEAATIVKRIRYYMEGSECWTDAEFIAMDMAVKALEQPEIVTCKDCKHRPIEKDGEIRPPKEDDWKCPCLCDDYFYSWRPKDNFFCANGERREDEEV